MDSKFQLDLQDRIVDSLETRPRSTKDLEDLLNANYYSVRKALKTLEGEGRVFPILGNGLRNVKYRLGAAENSNYSMPTISLGNKNHKLQDFVTLYKQSNSPSGLAIANLPRHVAELFRLAEQNQDTMPNLELLRTRMIQDASNLKNMLDVYEQIIENPRNWDPARLKRYLTDNAYNPQLIADAISYFFGE